MLLIYLGFAIQKQYSMGAGLLTVFSHIHRVFKPVLAGG
jgi:hypothetical protein